MKINNPTHEWQLSFEGDWPTSVTFLSDSRHLVSGNRRGEIVVWKLPEAAPEPDAADRNDKDDPSKSPPDCPPVFRLDGHSNGITHLKPLPGGNKLVSASLDHTLRLWDVDAAPSGNAEIILDTTSRERLARNKRGEDKEQILSAPGVTVAVHSATHLFEGHSGWINGLDVNSDGTRMISGDDRCLSIVWDITKRTQLSSWHGYDRVWVRSAAMSPDGRICFTCEYADRRSSFDVPAAQARLWNADDGSLKLDLLKVWTPDVKDKDRQDTYGYRQKWTKLMKRGLVCAEFSPDGKLLAAGQGGETDTGQIHLVDVESGKILRTVSGHRYGACDVKFSADGRFILSSGRDTMVRICQVSDGREVAALGKSRGGQFKDWMHAITISPDQQWVAAADIAGLVHVWRLDSAQT